MAGLTDTSQDVSRVVGAAVVALAEALADIAGLNGVINDADRFNGVTGLVARGFTQDDAQLIVDSLADLAALAAVAKGQREQIGLNNFFYHAKRLAGVNAV